MVDLLIQARVCLCQQALEGDVANLCPNSPSPAVVLLCLISTHTWPGRGIQWAHYDMVMITYPPKGTPIETRELSLVLKK